MKAPWPSVILITGAGKTSPDARLMVNLRDRTLSRMGNVSKFAPKEFRIVAAAVLAGGLISNDDFIDYVWGDEPDGGPLNCMRIVHVRFHGCKKRLERVGLHYRKYLYGSIELVPYVV